MNDAPDGLPRSTTVRPGADWPVLLVAGRVQDVLDDATHRLRLAGVQRVVRAFTGGQQPAPRLAALLLVRITDGRRLAALRGVADLPPQPIRTASQENQEITA